VLRFVSVLLLTLVAVLPARAQTSASPGGIEPGIYDLEITFGGGILAGTLTLRAQGDSLGVTLLVNDHESPVRPTGREGSRLVLESSTPGTDIRYQLEFRGAVVTGSFTYNGDPGSVTGKRRPGP